MNTTRNNEMVHILVYYNCVVFTEEKLVKVFECGAVGYMLTKTVLTQRYFKEEKVGRG